MDYQGTGDHDMLVKINTQVDRLLMDVKLLNDNTVKKIDKLEYDKFDKMVAEKMHGETLGRLKIVDEKIEALEEWRWKVAGGLVIVTVIASYFIQKYL